MASLYGPLFLVDLRALPRDVRLRALAIVREIEASPEPDGVFKREAPLPFKPGTIVAVSGGLAVRYASDAGGLRFYRVQVVDRS